MSSRFGLIAVIYSFILFGGWGGRERGESHFITASLCFFFSVPQPRIPQLGPPAASPSSGLVGPPLQLEQPGGLPTLLLLLPVHQPGLHPDLGPALLRLRPGRSGRRGGRKPAYTWPSRLFVAAPPPPPHPPGRGGVPPLPSHHRVPPPSGSCAPGPLCAPKGPQGPVARAAQPAAGPGTSAPSRHPSQPPAAPHDVPRSPEEEELLRWGGDRRRGRRRPRQPGWLGRRTPRLQREDSTVSAPAAASQTPHGARRGGEPGEPAHHRRLPPGEQSQQGPGGPG